MNNKLTITAAVMSLSLLFLAGCGQSSSAPAASKPDTASAPNASAAASQTAAGTTTVGDADKGKAIFEQSCLSCHSTGADQVVGPGLKGETSKDKLANGNPMNDDNLKAWIKTGGTGKIGNMPGMGGTISDEQINDIVAYLKTLK